MIHRERITRALLIVITGLTFSTTGLAITHKEKPSADEQRAEIQKMRQDTLAQLFREDPESQAVIEGGQGYAVFSNFGMNLFLVSTGNGKGVVRDNASGEDIYMKMFSAGGGVGYGVKSFRGVFVFHTRSAFTQFVEQGWDFSGQADAAATTDADARSEAGAADQAVSLVEGVTVYQLTDKGLALQATLQGTKYWQDDELN